MRIAIIPLLLAPMLVCALDAAERGPSPPENRPAISLRAAIDLAEAHAKAQRIDLSKHYLYSVRLIPWRKARDKQAWQVVWERSQWVDDDEIEFIVEMDKKVTQQLRG